MATSGAELDAQLVLRGRDLVMVLLGLDAHRLDHGQHFGAHVGALVDRRDREIAALQARPVAQVAILVFGTGIVGAFLGIDLEEGVVHRHMAKAHVVEHEELGFRAEEGVVANAGRSPM